MLLNIYDRRDKIKSDVECLKEIQYDYLGLFFCVLLYVFLVLFFRYQVQQRIDVEKKKRGRELQLLFILFLQLVKGKNVNKRFLFFILDFFRVIFDILVENYVLLQ